MKKVDAIYFCRWDRENKSICVPRLSKEQLLTIHPRYILKHKPNGLSGFKDEEFILFKTPENVSKQGGFPSGEYGVLIKDYKEALSSLPHIPNKKESKEIRKQKKNKNND